MNHELNFFSYRLSFNSYLVGGHTKTDSDADDIETGTSSIFFPSDFSFEGMNQATSFIPPTIT